MKIGVAFADVFTGLYAAIAIEAALIERSRSGLGQHIDMSLLDVMVGVLANQALNYLVLGVSPRRMGNSHPNVVPYQVFPTADGHVVIAVGTDAQFLRLARSWSCRSSPPRDPRFQSNAGRVTARVELVGKHRCANYPLDAGRASLGAGTSRSADRADLRHRRSLFRPTGGRPRNASRTAGARCGGGHRPGRSHADHVLAHAAELYDSFAAPGRGHRGASRRPCRGQAAVSQLTRISGVLAAAQAAGASAPSSFAGSVSVKGWCHGPVRDFRRRSLRRADQ